MPSSSSSAAPKRKLDDLEVDRQRIRVQAAAKAAAKALPRRPPKPKLRLRQSRLDGAPIAAVRRVSGGLWLKRGF